jgi:HlyD family secretion protein
LAVLTIDISDCWFVEHGTASGTVRWISEGAFSQDDNGSPVDPLYKARIALTEVKLKGIPDSFRLVPGMTLTADVQVGRRSVFIYMWPGVIRGVGEAMREPRSDPAGGRSTPKQRYSVVWRLTNGQTTRLRWRVGGCSEP